MLISLFLSNSILLIIFILTASYSPNTDSNAQPHHVHNAFYNAHDNHLGDNAHNDADKHRLHHAQAATALSPL